MFEDALRYPWAGEHRLETILVGGVLTLLGVLFVPILVVYGYLVRVVRAVSAGDDAVPPAFDDWGELLVDGVVAFVVSFVYALVPATFVTVAVLTFVIPVTVVGGTEVTQLPRTVAAGGVLLAILVAVLAVVVLLGALYLLPAALAAYAVTGRIASAFSPSTLRAIGGDGSYAIALIVALVIGFLAQVIGGLAAATVIGVLLVPFITFYGNVAAAYAIGIGVRDTPLVRQHREDSPSGQPAV
ncbi:DUF4013 domain-containing protein [Halomicroarcula sp. GCM10025709]|uniref:DUF4013 domain-containing protein n=1 Tax=Haloarcula TaxID=2237 RepID=UPI0024C25A03|nr:DUF4013 domain-containing protein [Halomicroarcula sp. YJ-61-S]